MTMAIVEMRIEVTESIKFGLTKGGVISSWLEFRSDLNEYGDVICEQDEDKKRI